MCIFTDQDLLKAAEAWREFDEPSGADEFIVQCDMHLMHIAIVDYHSAHGDYPNRFELEITLDFNV